MCAMCAHVCAEYVQSCMRPLFWQPLTSRHAIQAFEACNARPCTAKRLANNCNYMVCVHVCVCDL